MAVAATSGRGEGKDEELERLRKEVAQLRKEKEVLKKLCLGFNGSLQQLIEYICRSVKIQ